MIDYSRKPAKPESYWLCEQCAKNLNYAQQIWGAPAKPCDWCKTFAQLKLYERPLRPKIGPGVELLIG